MHHLYETHCHSRQCSRCAHSTSSELVQAYHAAGYAGLVLTDHFILGNTAVDRTLPWDAQMHLYHDAYLQAKAIGDTLDFDVIFGIEHACEGSEYLCYGIDLPFLLSHPEIPQLSLARFAQLVHDYGGILIQAHPFRWAPAGTPLRTELIDGIEVFNAGNSPEANRNAQNAAQAHMILTSGGDIHIATDTRIGTAGIILPYRIHDEKELVTALNDRHHAPLLP